jgi:hypothetical protein
LSDYLQLSGNDEEFSRNEKKMKMKFGINSLKPHFLYVDDLDDENTNFEKLARNNDNYEKQNTNIQMNKNLLLLDKIINDDKWDKEKINHNDFIRNNFFFDTAFDNAKYDEYEDEEASLINRNSILNGLLVSFSSKTSLPIAFENPNKKKLLNKIEKDLSKSLDSNITSVENNDDKLNSTNNFTIESNDILKLINVSHLLEYQSQSNSSPSLLSSLNNHKYFKSDFNLDNRIYNNSNSLLRGGNIDALIILATSSACFVAPSNKVKVKNAEINNSHNAGNNTTSNIKSNTCNKSINNRSNFMFQEAFLMTYRTFIRPIDLINKLIYRYRLFTNQNSIKLKEAANLLDSSIEFKVKKYDFENNQRFDLNRLKIILKNNRMTKLISVNCLTFLVRVVDEIRYFFINIILINIFF